MLCFFFLPFWVVLELDTPICMACLFGDTDTAKDVCTYCLPDATKSSLRCDLDACDPSSYRERERHELLLTDRRTAKDPERERESRHHHCAGRGSLLACMVHATTYVRMHDAASAADSC